MAALKLVIFDKSGIIEGKLIQFQEKCEKNTNDKK